MRTAYAAHAGQVDKCGVPYIFHPIHLAEQMPDEISVCAALLHDVAEDTDITLSELESEFPSAVIDSNGHRCQLLFNTGRRGGIAHLCLYCIVRNNAGSDGEYVFLFLAAMKT